MIDRVRARLLVLWALACLAMPADAQVFIAKPAHEPITLEIDSAVNKTLATLEDFVANQQWDVVATVLKQTQTERPDKLVPIGQNWYVSAERYCQLRAALLPDAGLAAYRHQIDSSARQWLAEAERTPDRNLLLRVVRQGFASSAAVPALTRLAEQSFEQGDFAAARTYWELLLPAPTSVRTAAGIGLGRVPEAQQDPAQLRAQLVLCSLFSGNLVRAERERAAFDALHSQAIGTLAGQQGALSELLAEQFVRHRPLLLGKPQRDLTATNLQIERVGWRVSLPPSVLHMMDSDSSSNDPGDMLPLVIDGKVFVSNGESVFAWDLKTGRPAWSNDNRSAEDVDAAKVYSLAEPVPPKWPVEGRSWHSLSVVGARLYARLGTPVTGKAKQEPNAHSELVGLDIGAGEGKLVWRVAASDIDPRDPLAASAPWCFEGAPTADERRVFAVLRRSLPQEQINVACFDGDTARLLWNRKVGITVASTDETVNSASHLQVTLAEDSVFLSTDAGEIAALDAHDGALRWVRTYETDSPFTVRERRRTGHTPPLYHDGVVYVAPLDSRRLFAIHAESGLLLWQREWPDPIQHLLGIVNDTLVVSGRSLWGIRTDRGLPAWPNRQVGFDDPEGSSFGRGVIVGHDVWWPTREELWQVSANNGQILRRLPVKNWTGQIAGHLTAFQKFLLVTHGQRLMVLGPE